VTVSSRIATYLVAGALALALVFYVFGRIDQLLSSRDAEITHGSKTLLALHARRIQEREKIRRLERGRQLLVDSLTHLAEAADSADSARAVAAGQPIPTPSPWKPVAQGCSLVVLACQARAENAEREAADYHRQLTDQVTVRDHRCGLWAGGGWGTAGKLEAQLGLGCRLVRVPLLP
jgi:hypothetical protein